MTVAIIIVIGIVASIIIYVSRRGVVKARKERREKEREESEETRIK